MTITTLADAHVALTKDTLLPARRRADLLSAFSRIGEYAQRPLPDIPLEPAKLRAILALIRPAKVGITPKTFANVRANLTAALRHVGALPPALPKAPLTPPWEAFLEPVRSEYHQLALNRFMNFCGLHGIEPQNVDADTVHAYRSHLEGWLLANEPQKAVNEICKAWNVVASRHDGPYAKLVFPERERRHVSAPLSIYPSTLQSEIDQYLDRLSHADIFAEDGPDKALRPVSIRNVRLHIRQFLGALVESGLQAEDFMSLRAVTTEANIKRAAQQIHNRRKLNRPPVGLFNMTASLLAMARYHLELPETEVVAIKRIKSRLAPIQSGMTTKNSERLSQLHDHQNVIRLLTLPDVLLQQALERPAAATSPLRAMFSVATCILLACPMRMKNLASLDIDKNFTVQGSGGRRIYSIRIDARDVKNGVPIEVKLNKRNSEMLWIYLEQFRHRLSDVPSTAMFPRKSDGKPRDEGNLGQSISHEVLRHTGLEINPHLFRHVAAYLYLKERPGDFETVRRLLKHKKLQTTMEFYAELSSQWAHEHYDTVVLSKWSGRHV